MTDDRSIRTELKNLRLRAGMSIREVASRLRVGGASTYSSYERTYKKSYLPPSMVTQLVKMYVGKGDPPIEREDVISLSGDPHYLEVTADNRDFQPYPKVETRTIQELDASAHGGSGAMFADLDGHERHPVIGQWALPADLLNAHVTPGMRPVVIRMVGDSMEPDFASGDRVMVDVSARTPSPPGIYVIWDGLGLILKRCEMVLGSSPRAVRISSANPAYATYEMALDDIQIQGRVMGKWTWK